jgi:hypothetical protein
MSAAYRESSKVTPELLERDPENRLLARGARYRLPPEMLRDQALAVSGLLVEKVGGPSVKPYQPPGLWQELFGGRGYEADKGEGLYRRSLYTYWRRTIAPPSMMNFDSPSREVCVVRESRTNTPLQALNLMNDPVFFEAAQGLAFRIMRETKPGNFRDRLNYAYAITLGREASAREAERMGKYFDETSRNLAAKPETVTALFPNRLEGVPQAETAAWVELSRVLLNLDEFITRD